MKKDKPSKKKVKPESDVFHYLEGELAYAIDKIKTDYLIEIDISRKDEFIKQIAESTPEEIVKILKATDSFIKHLFPNGISVNVSQDNPRHVNVDFHHMLRDALSDAKSMYFHPLMREGFPDDSLALCYAIIWSQALLRIYLYLESNPNARDALYLLCADILEAEIIPTMISVKTSILREVFRVHIKKKQTTTHTYIMIGKIRTYFTT